MATYKRFKLSGIWEGLRLFKGLCLLFLPNVPGATIIQGGTFIPESRVPVVIWHTLVESVITPWREMGVRGGLYTS